nr:MAG TPA: minor tail protein [Caudoviricetes sp.]
MAWNRELEAIIKIAGSIDPSLQKSLQSAKKEFGGLKLGMAAIGTAAVAATAAVVKLGVDAVKSAAAFEQQMANVATLLDGTKEQVSNRIGELGDDVLAVSNKTGVATDELTDGLYQIISAVGDSEDAITQMELAAKAAKAGGAETTDAINLLTAVTKGYNDTSGEAFQKASDLAFETVKLGQTSFPELASSIGKVIPLASALGVEQEELFGSFAALTGVTGSTAEVSTQMKAVMSGLMQPTQQMTDALNALGYANADAALESLGFNGLLQSLKSTMGDDVQATAKLFSSVEAQTAILALAGAQSEDLTNKTLAMYDAQNATEKAFEAQTDTLEYTIQVIKNLGKNFLTSIGRKILPVVKSVAEQLLPAIETGLDNIMPLFDSIYAAASPLINVIGDYIATILPILQSEMESVKGVFGLIQPILENIGTKLGPVFQEIFTKITEVFQDLQPVFGDFISNLFPAIGECIDALLPIVETVLSVLSPILDMVGQLVKSLLPALTSIIQFLMPVIKVLASVFSEYLGNAISYIMPIIQNIVNVFSGICDFITNVFAGNWSAAWDNVVSIFQNYFQAIVGYAKAPINAVVSIINGVIQGINECGFTIPDWVPVVGGKDFRINIPEIPMFASGGFTNGPSVAGEAGTEAVISFDSAYRSENLSYWAKAGRMLGVDDSLFTAFETGSRSNGDSFNFTFAPQITINGTGNAKEDIIQALKDEEEEFMDFVEERLRWRGSGSYVYG